MPRLTFLLPFLCLAGCDRPTAGLAPVAAESVRTYEAKGVLQSIRAEALRAVIAHEKIAGYMEAMTMEFAVPDARDLAAAQPGETIAFRLSVTDDRSWIDRVQKVGPGAAVAPQFASEAPRLLVPGAPLPDCALINQRGESLRLHDFKGRALAITFIFTHCPLPDFCPRMTAHFAAVQAQLAAGARTKWHLLSISIDPEYDTPERLAAYAARFQPNAAHWTFATGTNADLEKLSGAFGLRVIRAAALPDHNLRTVVVDTTGRVQKVFIGNEWKPEELIAEMQRAMAAQP